MTSTQVQGRSWFTVRAASDGRPRTADVDIFDEIGWKDWDGNGTTAADFTRQLRALDVDTIRLHVNSPGGDVFQGVAILNALRSHPARVVATVEGVAASAASFIVQAGDEVVMARNSELMIHDAAGFAVGNAETMADLAERLDKVSNNIASIYAERAGGTVEQWRAAMKAETWYSAEEAVEAGLADRVDSPLPADEVAQAKARFDLSIYNYAGRAAAPGPRAAAPAERSSTESVEGPATVERVVTPQEAQHLAEVLPDPPPQPPAASAAGSPTERGAGMDPAKLREAAGLPADASDDETQAAIVAALGLEPPQANAGSPAEPPAPAPAAPKRAPQLQNSEGPQYVDPAVIAELQEQARQGQEALRLLNEQRCDKLLDEAVAAGKFPPARREHYKNLWAADPDGTEELVKGMAPGLVPVNSAGYSGVGQAYEDDLVYKAMYGERAGV